MVPMQSVKSDLSRRPDVRFIAVSSPLAGLFLLAYREDVLAGPPSAWVELTARATTWLLHRLGLEAVRTAAVIHHPGGFAYEIYYRCTGVLPAAILAILILAHPGSWRRKCLGLAAGVPLLVALNLRAPGPSLYPRGSLPGRVRPGPRFCLGSRFS